ncbi:hypothetical protein CNEO3_250001 [Clostridium neonatale]|nr:hypothetical protein CNEO3_250001 [Clostridium neonatale]
MFTYIHTFMLGNIYLTSFLKSIIDNDDLIYSLGIPKIIFYYKLQ